MPRIPKNIEEAVNGLIAPWHLNFSDLLEKAKVSEEKVDNPDPRKWLTISTAEKYSGILRHTLRRAVKAQKIQCSKLGTAKSSKVLIERASLDAWLERCRENSSR